MSDLFTSPGLFLVTLIKIVVLLFLMLTVVAYLVWLERKISAHMQSRWGPYRVGPYGLLQPLADLVKFIFKEDVTPDGADRFIYFLAPMLGMTLAITAIALIPFGPGVLRIFGYSTPLVIADANVGVLILFAITSLGVYGVALAGWSSNNKYSLLGGLRSSAQMVSYELSLTLSVVGVLLLANSFRLSDIISAQAGYTWGFLPKWNLFSPAVPQVLGLFCYFVSAVAETNRLPFDLAEAESELVAGYHTEYSSLKFAMFFTGEYAAMVIVSCLATVLFLGGWLSPFPQGPFSSWTRYLPTAVLAAVGLFLIVRGVRYPTKFARIQLPILGIILCLLAAGTTRPDITAFIQGPFWFLVKAAIVIFIYMWIRWTLPRFRYDQLMSLGWKFLLPLALFNVVLTSLLVVLHK